MQSVISKCPSNETAITSDSSGGSFCSNTDEGYIDRLIYYSPSELFRSFLDITDEDRCLVLDCRENRSYQTKHLTRAINCSCHSKMMTRRSIQSWSRNYSGGAHKRVFLYDQKSERGQISSNLLSFINVLLEEEDTEVALLESGWAGLIQYLDDRKRDEQFASCCGIVSQLFESSIEKDLMLRYTYSPTSSDAPCDDVLNAEITQIEPFLFLGNARDSQDRRLLVDHAITHIINVTNNVENTFEHRSVQSSPESAESDVVPNIEYHRLAASDSSGQDLYQFFNQAFALIESIRQQGSARALIHCWAGVSRSATIVIAYLMRLHGWDSQRSLEHVHALRPVVAPNLNFMGQLERYFRTEVSGRPGAPVNDHGAGADAGKLGQRPELSLSRDSCVGSDGSFTSQDSLSPMSGLSGSDSSDDNFLELRADAGGEKIGSGRRENRSFSGHRRQEIFRFDDEEEQQAVPPPPGAAEFGRNCKFQEHLINSKTATLLPAGERLLY